MTDLSSMTDEELTERAREVFRQLWRRPRAHPDNEHLIRTWGALCAQMNTRGLPGDITPDRDRDIHLAELAGRAVIQLQSAPGPHLT